MDQLECLKCKHKWFQRVVRPLECPHCQSRTWFKPTEGDEDECNSDVKA